MLKQTQLAEHRPSSTTTFRGTEPTLEDLTSALQAKKSKVETRLEAAYRLRAFGHAGVEALCAVLRDKDDRVRAAAAESLGLVADERAVQPLVDALRDSFPGRSAVRNRVGRVLFQTVAMPVAVIGLVAMVATGNLAGLVDTAAAYNANVPEKRRSPQEIARALFRIAQRTSSPELRKALPELQELAEDSLSQDKRTHAASRKAARQIAQITDQLHQLPLTASAPTPSPETLPRASEEPHY